MGGGLLLLGGGGGPAGSPRPGPECFPARYFVCNHGPLAAPARLSVGVVVLLLGVCVCVCAEAVQLANDTEYGLAAYFYTQVGWCRVGVGVGWGAVVEGQGAVGNRQFIRGWPSFVRMDIPSPLPPHPSRRTCRARGGSRSACNTAWWA